jgi:hypothetical protein
LNEFETLKASLQSYDSEIYLGTLCWYSVFELKVEHREFCQLLLANNLGGFLPPPPRGSDVFKRVCTDAEIKRDPTNDPAIFRNYQIKEVDKDRDNIYRKLVAETVDSSNRRLDWEVLAELHYNRPNNIITVTLTDEGKVDPQTKNVTSKVLRLYREWNNCISSQHVRRLVRDVFRNCLATAVRPSGGIYFVRQAHRGRLESLAAVLAALPGGTELHTLPLLDDSKQRLMLRRAFEEESVGEIDSLLGDAKELLSSGQTLTADRFAKFTEESVYLRKKAKEYSSLLNEKLVETDSRLEILDTVLFSLANKIRHKRDNKYDPQ